MKNGCFKIQLMSWRNSSETLLLESCKNAVSSTPEAQRQLVLERRNGRVIIPPINLVPPSADHGLSNNKSSRVFSMFNNLLNKMLSSVFAISKHLLDRLFPVKHENGPQDFSALSLLKLYRFNLGSISLLSV